MGNPLGRFRRKKERNRNDKYDSICENKATPSSDGDFNRYDDVGNLSDPRESLPWGSENIANRTIPHACLDRTSINRQRCGTPVPSEFSFSDATYNTSNVAPSSLLCDSIRMKYTEECKDSPKSDTALTDQNNHLHPPHLRCFCRSCSQSSHDSMETSSHTNFQTQGSTTGYDQYQTSCHDREDITTVEILSMIDVFYPLLRETIKVVDIVPHIPFIDVTVTLEDGESQSDDIVPLINRLKEKPEKCRAFLESLSKGGYKYIHDLLKCETEKDLETHRLLSRLFKPRVLDMLDLKEFIDHLYKRNVIEENDMEEIKSEERNRGTKAALLMVLECVTRTVPDWYSVFVDVMTACGLDDLVNDFTMPSPEDIPPTAPTSGDDPVNAHNFYLTPVYESEFKPPLPNSPPPALGDCTNISDLDLTTAQWEDDYNYSQPSEESLEIVKLQAIRNNLYDRVKKVETKKKLMKDIDKLREQLLLLEDDMENCEMETSKKKNTNIAVKENRVDFREVEVEPAKTKTTGKDNTSNTNETGIMTSQIQGSANMPTTMVVLRGDTTREDVDGDIQTQNSVPDLGAEVCIIYRHPPTQIGPPYNSRPVTPHIFPITPMTHLMNRLDSGFCPDYQYMYMKSSDV